MSNGERIFLGSIFDPRPRPLTGPDRSRRCSMPVVKAKQRPFPKDSPVNALPQFPG
jgi:hypothetical protein